MKDKQHLDQHSIGSPSPTGATNATRRVWLYHYPPGANCVMCGAGEAEQVVEVRGGCIPVCSGCDATNVGRPVVACISTHPAATRGLLLEPAPH